MTHTELRVFMGLVFFTVLGFTIACFVIERIVYFGWKRTIIEISKALFYFIIVLGGFISVTKAIVYYFHIT